jgi:DNA-binding MurR/RpiR family transcriptional regulator
MGGSEGYRELRVKEKQRVIRKTYQPYQRSGTKDPSHILDEVIHTHITGLNRK